MSKYCLSDIADFISEKVDFSSIELEEYISTDNMLPNFNGITLSSVEPSLNKCTKFKANDTLFSNIRTYFKKVWFADFDGGCSPDVIVMRTKNEELVLPEFLYLLICSEDFINFTVMSSNGAKMPRGDKKAMLKYEFEIPSIEEQKIAINHYFKIKEKIHLNTQINQTLEQIAQALFKSWFIDFDPVRAKVQALSDGLSLEQAELAAMQAISGKTAEELTALSQAQPDRYAELAETAKAFPCEMVEVDGVEVPKGWNLKALDEIANYQNGLALQKFRPEDDEPFLPVVKIAQLRQGYADGEEKAKASIKPECIIDNGDVIFSWSGSLLVDIWCGGKAALNQHLFKVTSKRYPKWFYYFYTKYHLAEFQRIAYDKAVTMGHIKREHLSAAKCIVPNDELLANKTLENILEKIIFNRLENFNLQDTRDLLLPRLLNGEMIDA